MQPLCEYQILIEGKYCRSVTFLAIIATLCLEKSPLATLFLESLEKATSCNSCLESLEKKPPLATLVWRVWKGPTVFLEPLLAHSPTRPLIYIKYRGCIFLNNLGITGRLTFQEEQFGEEDGKDPSGEGDRLCESRHRGWHAAAQQQGEAEKGHLEVENFQKQSETFNCAYNM